MRGPWAGWGAFWIFFASSMGLAAEPPKSPAAAPPATAAPAVAPPAAGKRVMVTDLATDGVDKTVGAQATQLVAEFLDGRDGHTAVTMDDLREVVGVETLRSKLGCQDQNCVSDISRISQTDLLVNGAVGKVAGTYVLSLALLDPRSAQVTERAQQTSKHLKDLPRMVQQAVASLFHWSPEAERVRFTLPSGKKTSFAVLDLVPNGVPADDAANLTQVLSSEIKRVDGASVISRDDIAAVLQLEATKSALGCDDTSCLAELGGALGVEKLVVGNVGKLGDTKVVSLRLISVAGVKVDNRVSESFAGPDDQLLGAVRHAARKLLGLETKQQGGLGITSSEEGAEVFVDGDKRGKLPIKPVAGLPAGPHSVRVARSGFYDFNSDVYVDPGSNTLLWVELQQKPLKWYQRWWVWTILGVTSGGLALLSFLVLGLVAGVVLGVWRLSTSDPPNASGSATLR